MNSTNEVVAYAETTISIKAQNLLGKGGITISDLEDIKSEIMLDVLRRLSKHNSKKWSFKTFIPLIVENKARSILEHRFTEKEKAWRKVQSLDASLCQGEDEKSTPLHEICPSKRPEGGIGLTEFEQFELKEDIEQIVSKLSLIQQKCCRKILQGRSLSKIAEDFSIPRATFYGRILSPIRLAFSKAGLKGYQQKK